MTLKINIPKQKNETLNEGRIKIIWRMIIDRMGRCFLKKHKKAFVIGDIHGHVTALTNLINKIDTGDMKNALLIFLGDYIDRGPHSKEVIDYLMQLETRGWNCVFLCGNHEKMFLDFINNNKTNDGHSFIFNGGAATLASYGCSVGEYQQIEKHRDFFQNLKYFYRWNGYFFVHAGIPNAPISEILNGKHNHDLIWITDGFINGSYSFGEIVVHGHTPTEEVYIDKRRIGIDTGAGAGRMLTCVELPSKKVISVPAYPNDYRPLLEKNNNWQYCRQSVRYSGDFKIDLQYRNTITVCPMQIFNYSEFGVMCFGDENYLKMFLAKDDITGFIHLNENRKLPFKGVVVRTEIKAGLLFLALKFNEKIIFADELSLFDNDLDL